MYDTLNRTYDREIMYHTLSGTHDRELKSKRIRSTCGEPYDSITYRSIQSFGLIAYKSSLPGLRRLQHIYCSLEGKIIIHICKSEKKMYCMTVQGGH